MRDVWMAEEVLLSCGLKFWVNLAMWESPLCTPWRGQPCALQCFPCCSCCDVYAWLFSVGRVYGCQASMCVESCFTALFFLQRKWPLAQARS